MQSMQSLRSRLIPALSAAAVLIGSLQANAQPYDSAAAKRPIPAHNLLLQNDSARTISLLSLDDTQPHPAPSPAPNTDAATKAAPYSGLTFKPRGYEFVDGQAPWSDGLIHAWLLTEATGDTLQDSVADGQPLANRDLDGYVWDFTGYRRDLPDINAKLAAGVNFVWTPTDDLPTWTIAVKVRPLGANDGNHSSRCLWRDAKNSSNALYLWKGTQGFYVGGNEGGNTISYPVVPGMDYVIVVDNSGNLYVNGASAGAFPGVLGDVTTSGLSWMSDSYNQGFGGLWYFARVWNRALSPEEVAGFSRHPYADLPRNSAMGAATPTH